LPTDLILPMNTLIGRLNTKMNISAKIRET
jgi:hypothetical protein